MSSKTKKGKKKAKTANDVAKTSKEVITNKKIFTYFTNEELGDIKSVMKIKDATGVPFVIGATILHKINVLKQLIKDGYNINQTGQNNMTALLWAVKYKYVDIVEYLLNNGADPTIKTDSGDNVLIAALEHKLWDEDSMINLWKAVKKISFIDVNFTNKNGHNMLHMCVRKDWERLLKILVSENPNVDAGNSNGVTPLMLACFRNNLSIIQVLIESGADILKEDNHGRMTLCYAISSSLKMSHPPFPAIEKLITELKNRSALDTYFKRRLELVVTTAKKLEISCATSEMLIKIIQFSVQHIHEGLEIFLDCDVFTQLLDVLESRLDNTGAIKFLLEVCQEIVFYNEQSLNYSSDTHQQIIESFCESGFADVCLEFITRNLPDISKIAFNLLILALNNDDKWEKMLEQNYQVFLPLFNDHQIIFQDEGRVKMLKNKKRKLKKIFDRLDIVPSSLEEDKHTDEKKKTENTISLSKKSKRRSKAIKAKLIKMKSLELSKRLNLNNKKLAPQKSSSKIQSKSDSVQKFDLRCEPEDYSKSENPIVDSLRHLLQNNEQVNEQKCKKKDGFPNWKHHIATWCHVDIGKNFSVDQAKLSQAMKTMKVSVTSNKFENIKRSLNVIIDYLKQLMQMIVRKYREHWENDKLTGNCNCRDLNEHVPWLYNRHLKNLEAREQQVIQDVQKNFDHLIKTIKDMAHKNMEYCLTTINKLESALLSYDLRGIKVLAYVAGRETFAVNCTTSTSNLVDDPKLIIDHMQNVLNNVEQPRKDIDIEILDEIDDISFIDTYKSETPTELYYREMSMLSKRPPKDKQKEIEAKLNTIANGFHLINSIMSICDDPEDNDKPKKVYGVSDLNQSKIKHHKVVHHTEISEYMPKRLKAQISSLQNGTTFQRLVGGEIRISNKEQRLNYIISAGINFSAVELGLDISNQPLAVKRIPRESWVGKVIKTLVDPLLGFVDNHILHYFACEYEGNELILATPLCKWNMSQYVQLLRQSNMTTMPRLTGVEIVKQFLDGLVVLHKCDIPIVHGNLKPSNIFIDFNGIVKVGEFGIHKALYKIIEAPKSSLIWFAKETLDIYRNSSILECTLKTDIHVAGMLIYFILTYGKHPYGEDTEEILKNLQRGTTKLTVRNLDLRDLLAWMMLTDFNQRPNIDQVLSHTFFWPSTKKWNFILCCAGINQSGYPLPINVEKLHRSIDSFCESYIKLDWQDVMHAKYPHVKMSDNTNIVGLLKFIRYCHDHQMETHVSDSDLSSTILTLFPILPVALFRTLQNTNWLKHAIFMSFVEMY